MSAERDRLQTDPAAWRRWGPYLAERAWGTVREDYSADGSAWEDLPHDHARSRAFRWNEDGMAGICDDLQGLCLAVALWNEADPFLKERHFGLTGNEGNHGEDAKEYWFYLDATPTHSYARWHYLYPHRAFPYADLYDVNRRRGRGEPEYELLDTGVFADDRYFAVTVEHAKADPDDILVRIEVENRGPETAPVHILPTLWFRNTWAWGRSRHPRPRLWAERGDVNAIAAEHYRLGRRTLVGSGAPGVLFCDNDTNTARLFGVPGPTYPKDGINDHVVAGAATVNPAREGTKAAFRYRVELAPAETVEVRVRLTPGDANTAGVSDDFGRTLGRRRQEADEFYAEVIPADVPKEAAAVARQAFAGMLWAKQWYHFDVEHWLEGDPAQPAPPRSRRTGRNAAWWHLNATDVISMPDPWEYPWFAAWDLAFHTIPLAHLDPGFAKAQLLLLLREWYQHPNGQLPAYEWAFGDVNPPVHSWAALRVYDFDRALSGIADTGFLARVFHKLLLNFTWWVNRKDEQGKNLFSGGFLGLDNIGPIDRSAPLPVPGRLEQADGTAWMAMYCLNMLAIAVELAGTDPTYEDMATKFVEHFCYISQAANGFGSPDAGLWRGDFYYDVLHADDGREIVLPSRSLVGVIPLLAVETLSARTLRGMPQFTRHLGWFVRNKPEYADAVATLAAAMDDTGEHRLLSLVGTERLRQILVPLLDEAEFLSPYGVRSLSRRHLEQPMRVELAGQWLEVRYDPAESSISLFGGNSNWRGPVWFPVNYLLLEALRTYHRFLGDTFTVEYPTGSDRQASLGEVADAIAARLVSIFLPAPDGTRPVHGSAERFQTDAAWNRLLPFHEYFHGDTGAGLGASHQTGWTGLVADLVVRGRPPDST